MFKDLLANTFKKMFGWVSGRMGKILAVVGKTIFKVGRFLYSLISKLSKGVMAVFSNPAFQAIAAAAGVMDVMRNVNKNDRARWGQAVSEIEEAKRDMEYFRMKMASTTDKDEREKYNRLYDETEQKIRSLDAERMSLEDKHEGKVQSFWDATKQTFGMVLDDAMSLINFDPIEKIMGTAFDKLNLGSDLAGLMAAPDIDISDDLSSVKFKDNSNFDSVMDKLESFSLGDTLSSMFTPTNGGRGKQGGPSVNQLRSSGSTGKAPATVSMTTGNQIDSSSTDNQSTKLAMKTTAAPTITNTSSSVSSKVGGRVPVKRRVPSVRNQEPTYNQTIFNSIEVGNH
jgi:hypothetical protein